MKKRDEFRPDDSIYSAELGVDIQSSFLVFYCLRFLIFREEDCGGCQE